MSCATFQNKEWFAGDCNRTLAEDLLKKVRVVNLKDLVDQMIICFSLQPRHDFIFKSNTLEDVAKCFLKLTNKPEVNPKANKDFVAFFFTLLLIQQNIFLYSSDYYCYYFFLAAFPFFSFLISLIF